MWADPSNAQVETSGELSCFLSSTKDAEADPHSGLTFQVTLACPTGARNSLHDDAILFSGSAGTQLIVGASLTLPSNGARLADFDFPIHIVTLNPDAQVAWNLTAPPRTIGLYELAIFRLWTVQALTDCASGRDGCDKYGYILLWDQRLDADLLKVTLP
jgi:hypothetical protein